MRTRRGEVPPLVCSSVDGQLCTEYRDARMKRKMVRDGDMRVSVHCPGFLQTGPCACQPCVVCHRRICPRGPEVGPASFGPNGVWIGLHCFTCFRNTRPEFDAWYEQQIAARLNMQA